MSVNEMCYCLTIDRSTFSSFSCYIYVRFNNRPNSLVLEKISWQLFSLSLPFFVLVFLYMLFTFFMCSGFIFTICRCRQVCKTLFFRIGILLFVQVFCFFIFLSFSMIDRAAVWWIFWKIEIASLGDDTVIKIFISQFQFGNFPSE